MSTSLILAAGSGNANPLAQMLPIILIIGVFYLLVLRPQRRRAAQAQATLAAVEPGREVITAAGLRATVVAVDDDGFELEIAPGVRTRWLKGAVARVIPLPAEDDADSTTTEHDGPAS